MSYLNETVTRETWTMSGNCDPQYSEIEIAIDRIIDVEGEEPYYELRYFSAAKCSNQTFYFDEMPNRGDIERHLVKTEGRDWAMQGTIEDLNLDDEDEWENEE